jgi:hypothetical protein
MALNEPAEETKKMTLKSLRLDETIERMSSPHLADFALRSIKRARRKPLGRSQLATMREGLELVLLELEDRDEWKIADGLRRTIARATGQQHH